MNPLAGSRELAENKLIVLYLIKSIGTPVSNLTITRLMLENKFMNYFMLQQMLNELCESTFLTAAPNGGKSFYSLTPAGARALEYFTNLIPPGIKAVIDNSIGAIKRNIKNETLITADFTPESEKEFVVNCKVGEDGFPLIELNITVGTKSDARAVCENWKKYSQDIYPEIIESLLKKREKPILEDEPEKHGNSKQP